MINKKKIYNSDLLNILYLCRFSKDIDYLDNKLPAFLRETLIFGAPLIATIFVIVYSVPVLGLLFIPIVAVFTLFQVKHKAMEFEFYIHVYSSLYFMSIIKLFISKIVHASFNYLSFLVFVSVFAMFTTV